jgi:hypothetical protein
VKTMGFLGLFIGPVLMALLVAIWREWVREVEISAAASAEAPPPPPTQEDAIDEVAALEDNSEETTAFRKAAF